MIFQVQPWSPSRIGIQQADAFLFLPKFPERQPQFWTVFYVCLSETTHSTSGKTASILVAEIRMEKGHFPLQQWITIRSPRLPDDSEPVGPWRITSFTNRDVERYLFCSKWEKSGPVVSATDGVRPSYEFRAVHLCTVGSFTYLVLMTIFKHSRPGLTWYSGLLHDAPV